MENFFVDYWWIVFLFPIGACVVLLVYQISQMEKKYNPDGTEESSYKCECGFWVYHSSKVEHDKECDYWSKQ